VSANIGEGYSRRSGRDRARFYEYALGSAREARDWYYKARHVLDRSKSSIIVCASSPQIIRLLLTMIPRQRAPACVTRPDQRSIPPTLMTMSRSMTN
jgi:four helix bundle protein